MGATQPLLLVDIPALGPGVKCDNEYSAFDSISPGPLGSIKSNTDNSTTYTPTPLEIIDKAVNAFRAAQAIADAPQRLMSPATGALGPHLHPPRISPTTGQVILALDTAAKQEWPMEIMGRNGSVVPPFDPNVGPSASPNLRFIHGTGGPPTFGVGWGLAIKRVYNTSVSRATITTGYGDKFAYALGGATPTPIYPAQNAYANSGPQPIETQSNGVAYQVDAGNSRVAAVQFPNGGRWTSLYSGMGPSALLTGVLASSGKRATLAYDVSNLIRRVVNPDNSICTLALNGNSNLASVLGPGMSVPTGMGYDGNHNLINITAPSGERTTFGYDGSNRCKRVITPDLKIVSYAWITNGVGVIDPLRRRNTLNWDSQYKLQSWVDAQGNTTNYNWVSDRLKDVVDPLGNSVLVTHTHVADGSQRLQTYGPGGQQLHFNYGGNSQLSSISDDMSGSTNVSWDGNLNRTQFSQPIGTPYLFAYDTSNRLKRVQTPLTGTLAIYTMTYANWQRQALWDPLGGRTTSSYGSLGRISRVAIPPVASGPPSMLTTVTRDTLGRVQSISNPLSQSNSVGYDSGGRVSQIRDAYGSTLKSFVFGDRLASTTDPTGLTTNYAYNAAGDRVRTTDPLSNITTTVWDQVRRPIAMIDALLNRSTTNYDAASRVISTVDAFLKRTSNIWDPANRLVATINPLLARTSWQYDGAGRVIFTTDALGQKTSTIYDVMGRTLANYDALGRPTQYAYDVNSRRIQTTDPLGFVTQATYDLAGRQVGSINPQSQRTTNSYDSGGRLTSSMNELSQRTSFGYDNMARQVSVTNPLNQISSTRYDSAGRAIASINALSQRTTTNYDSSSRVISVVDALLNRTTNLYDGAGRLAAVVDTQLHRSTTVYDQLNRVSATFDALGNRTQRRYDAASRLIATIDAQGNRSSTLFDALARAYVSIDALNKRTTTIFDQLNRAVAAVDARGNRTSSVFDAVGRVVARIDALAKRSSSIFDPAGRQVATIDALSNRSTNVFDSVGRVVVTFQPLLQRNTSVFDAAGHMVASINPLQQRVTNSYDNAGRLLATLDPLLRKTTMGYDAAGRQIAVTDGNGHTTGTIYDVVGRVAATYNALGLRTTNLYDSLNRRTGLVDANGNRETFQLDAVGRQVVVNDPLNRRTSFGYDALGNQVRKLDARGTLVTMGYDAVSRLISEAYSTGKSNSYGYDAVGNRLQVIDSTGRYTNSYDARNQVTKADSPNGAINYVLDALMRRSVMTDPQGGRFSYLYDNNGRLTQVTNPQSTQTAMKYDNASRLIREVLGNGCISTFLHDAAGQKVAIVNGGLGGALINRFSYLYDKAGNRTRMADATPAVTTWLYDAAYQLTRETRSGVNGFDLLYQYDPVGNRLLQDGSDGRKAYAYDKANQILKVDSGTGRTTYTHDNCGNMTQEQPPVAGNTYYKWTEDNRLAVAEPVAGPVTMTYSALGKRTRKQAYGATTDFLYDFEKLLQELDGGAVTAQYTSTTQQWGDLLSAYDGTATAYHAYDALGWTDALLNDSGSSTDTWVYQAFGLQQARSGSTINPFQFVGRVAYYQDIETTLYYVGGMQARYYHPLLARWLSQDRVPPPGTINLYAYCGNDPVNVVDPSGLQPQPKGSAPAQSLLDEWNNLKVDSLIEFQKAYMKALEETVDVGSVHQVEVPGGAVLVAYEHKLRGGFLIGSGPTSGEAYGLITLDGKSPQGVLYLPSGTKGSGTPTYEKVTFGANGVQGIIPFGPGANVEFDKQGFKVARLSEDQDGFAVLYQIDRTGKITKTSTKDGSTLVLDPKEKVFKCSLPDKGTFEIDVGKKTFTVDLPKAYKVTWDWGTNTGTSTLQLPGLGGNFTAGYTGSKFTVGLGVKLENFSLDAQIGRDSMTIGGTYKFLGKAPSAVEGSVGFRLSVDPDRKTAEFFGRLDW